MTEFSGVHILIEETVLKREGEETINLKHKDDRDDINPPLVLEVLDTTEEIVMCFTEMNQFGLPRAVGKIDIGLGQGIGVSKKGVVKVFLG